MTASNDPPVVFPVFPGNPAATMTEPPPVPPQAVQTLSFAPAGGTIVPPVRTAEPEAEPAQTAAPDTALVVKEIQQATESALKSTVANVSKGELAVLLEGFAKVLRTDANYTAISYADHAAEVMQLKELLLEAQETIINLLNDRVVDRSKLARLEAEVKLLPDLQSQAHRAMGLASQTDEVQKELAHVRSEVERLRTNYMRIDRRGNWIDWLFRPKD